MDIAILRLYKNDFESAKRGDDSPAVYITKQPYIQLLTDGLISQKTNSLVDINFVGGIRVDLIDSCGNVVMDISDKFYYDGYLKDGIYQIDFEFGRIYTDFYYKSLFLKITDLINGNEFYSNSFCITDKGKELTSEIVYTAGERFAGVGYDLKPSYQRVRFRDLYYKDVANKKNGSEYVDTFGGLVNFRQTITRIKRFIFNQFDIALNDRIEEIFRHPAVYVNGQRYVLSEFKAEPIAGDTNFKTGELFLNPKEQYFTLGNQLFVDFNATITPNGRYVASSFPNNIELNFNKPAILGVGTLKIYNESNDLIVTFTEANITVVGTTFTIDNSAFVTDLDNYYIIISKGLFKSVGNEPFEVSARNERAFSITNGDWLNTDWNNADWLTN